MFITKQEQLQLQRALRESELLRAIISQLSASLDLPPILQTLVSQTPYLCSCERASVWLVDENRQILQPMLYALRQQKMTIQERRHLDLNWQQCTLPLRHPLLQQLQQQQGLLMLPDTRQEPGLHSLAEKFHIHGLLLLAIQREGRLLGLLALDRPNQTLNCSPEHIHLAQVIVNQAAIAIDHAHRYQKAKEERYRAERLISRAQSIYQVALAVNSDQPLDEVLAIAGRHLTRGLSADGTCIALREQDELRIIPNTKLRPLHLVPSEAYHSPLLIDLPHCQTAEQQGSPLFVRSEQLKTQEKRIYRQMGLENVLIIPLRLSTRQQQEKQGSREPSQSVGFIFVTYYQATQEPATVDHAFAQDVAAQCALAIEKAALLAESRKAAQLAQERAQTLSAVFNAMSEGIIVLDLDGQVMLTNQTAIHFLGSVRELPHTLDAFLSKVPIYTPQGHLLAPGAFPLSRALRGEHIRRERFLTRRTDGSERLVEINVEPLIDAEASRFGVVGAFRDVTEQVRVEQRLHLALETWLQTARDVATINDPETILRYILQITLNTLNIEHGLVLTYQAEEGVFTPLLSQGLSEEAEEQWLAEQDHWLHPSAEDFHGFAEQIHALHPTLINDEQCPFDQAPRFKNTMILAAPIVHDQQLFCVMLLDRSVPAKGDNTPTQALARREFNIWDLAIVEGLARFAGLTIEQTLWQQEARTAQFNERSLRKTSEQKDQFLAITAHEFRTPLTIILTHTQMIARAFKRLEEIPPASRQKAGDSLRAIETQAHLLTNIVNTFLEVSHLDSGQISMARERIELATLIREIIGQQRSIANTHQLSYQLIPAKGTFIVEGDRARLQQVFVNLIQNAVKYSPHGGPITLFISKEPDEAEVKVIVQDKGIGIPSEAQTHLFERFFRAQNISQSNMRGFGLGLYVVAEILRMHGGSVYAESSGLEGEGSRFICTLPLLDNATRPLETDVPT